MVNAAVDSAGNVVVAFEGDGVDAMYTLIYDAAAGIWGPATRLSPRGRGRWCPTLVSNDDGTAVYAVFCWVVEGAERGVYVSRFDTAGLAWNPPARLPGSATGQYPGNVGVGAAIPAAVRRGWQFDGAVLQAPGDRRQHASVDTPWQPGCGGRDRRRAGTAAGAAGGPARHTELRRHRGQRDRRRLLRFPETEARTAW